ncbi:Tat pathway signal sequence domain protein [Streptomyces sp. G2]|uniref:Tat pathway signal sequence domain protein n=3 Tax=Streptomyces TaxID=1883 RepID=UPI00202FEE0E|nr:Tat pathway signal sequence domain protein [Streptomyces sp. G2]MCM1946271.1 Tat pathway signal sequence domain protein [Streptomyces sp. G2]
MYEIVRRHLGKVVAGAAMAVTGTAVAVAISLPGTAGAEDTPAGRAAGPAAAPGTGAPSGARGTEGAGGAEGTGGRGAAALAPATVAPAAAEGDRGTGTDPLTDAELDRARTLALGPADTAARQDVDGDRGRPQHLGTELADPVPGREGDRRAQVRFYDYARDELVTRTVDLATGKVVSTATSRGVQPSAHPEELRAALDLILASPLGKGVEEDFRDATGTELKSADQLWFNGDVYRVHRERNVPEALSRCGEHRCVRLVTKVRNGAWIDTRNLIVDLSAKNVVRVG